MGHRRNHEVPESGVTDRRLLANPARNGAIMPAGRSSGLRPRSLALLSDAGCTEAELPGHCEAHA